ncbi:methyltransferase domain-containing protein [bacterium]|nr:methyltransferase domain-containing protein [bacterium]
MGEKTTFLKSFLRQPTQVGAIAPSGPGLVRAMVESFDWNTIENAVEFGPGTGVFTEAVLGKIKTGTTFFAIEQCEQMAAATRNRCPDARVYQDSVTNVKALCEKQSIETVDAVISGLPWAAFSGELQTEIMETMLDVLKPGGQFATFAYWQGLAMPAGQRFARRLRSIFSTVERSPTIWKNLPPAFVYRCTR